ncbi:MAG TPA: PQQ-binding-like beta-propeller repeat protein [Acidimicrobiales bacterium]
MPWVEPLERRPRHLGGGGGERRDGRRLLFLALGLVAVTVAAVVAPRVLPTDSAGSAEAPVDVPDPISGFPTPGLLTFRGSATRTYYGEGPIPQSPKVVWTYPEDSERMCSQSEVEQGEHSGDFLWCGSGWTGQPNVFERDGRTWVVFGAYDRKIHFVDWETGKDIIPPFETGDIIKGTVTIDPEGYPIVYSGSRDNNLRAIAFDGTAPRELWKLEAGAVSPTLWNDDWDGSPLVIGDYLYEGGENSQVHVLKLERTYDAEGMVQSSYELVWNAPGWDQELLDALAEIDPDRAEDVSIENSVAYYDGILYFANSGGLVQGWDVTGLAKEGGAEPERVFRFWNGDDTDASVVVDGEGFLYVASQNERGSPRAEEVGQLVKLDPRKPDDPVVWSLHDDKGFWATPAIHDDLLIAPADEGIVYGIDRATGEVRWTKHLPGPTWSSPVVVDDVWIQGDCAGGIHAFDVADTTVNPPELWNVSVVGCVESTPAVWEGRLFVGTRGGRFVAVGD